MNTRSARFGTEGRRQPARPSITFGYHRRPSGQGTGFVAGARIFMMPGEPILSSMLKDPTCSSRRELASSVRAATGPRMTEALSLKSLRRTAKAINPCSRMTTVTLRPRKRLLPLRRENLRRQYPSPLY